jgi:hypothetical protein
VGGFLDCSLTKEARLCFTGEGKLITEKLGQSFKQIRRGSEMIVLAGVSDVEAGRASTMTPNACQEIKLAVAS